MSKNRSTVVLYQMAAVFVVVLSIIYWQRDYLVSLYISNQITSVGWTVNGIILFLFLVGFFQLVRLFVIYDREEKYINVFSGLVDDENVYERIQKIPRNSLIRERYQTIADFFSARTEINHNALAATLLAKETSRTSFVKFINNILILTGVFGTIISLTVALLGASTAISETDSMRGIDVVIHGMSTALSTTMSAIFAYFMFGYFYLKLLDTQSFVLGRLEHVTATVLIPRYQIATRSVEQNLNEVLVSTIETIEKFDDFFQKMQQIRFDQAQVFARFEEINSQNVELLAEIKDILREGFRLESFRHYDDNQ